MAAYEGLLSERTRMVSSGAAGGGMGETGGAGAGLAIPGPAARGVAGWLATHDWAQKKVSDELRARLRESVVADDGRSLVDALDFVSTAAPTHGQLAAFSETGRERLRDAGRQLAFFRSRAGLPLLDFVRLIEQELRLDIELVANESRGLENLYAFHDTVGAFLDSDETGTLGSFLRWLARAERHDDLGPRPEPGEPGTVQLLTIHGAKGLEWDFVAIPNLTAKSLPAPAREVSGWLRFGELPYPFRGDRAELPELRWDQHDTQLSYESEFLAFKDELAARHDAEERRLIYVATTRAQHSLLLTGSYWASGSTVRKPSPFLVELVEAGLIPALPEGSVDTDKPASADTGLSMDLVFGYSPTAAELNGIAAANLQLFSRPIAGGLWRPEGGTTRSA